RALCWGSGSPYRTEQIISGAGYGHGILALIFLPVLWCLPTAFMIGELSSALPSEGGYYAWVRRALGPFWGFQEAWLSLAASIFDMAIYPSLFVAYLGRIFPAATAGHRGLAIAGGMVLVCVLWNLFGAKAVGASSVAAGVLLLSPFLALTIFALMHKVAVAPGPAVKADFLAGVLLAMWNFMGWDNAATVANEVENPQKTYPRVML